jgi:hypothetical protein
MSEICAIKGIEDVIKRTAAHIGRNSIYCSISRIDTEWPEVRTGDDVSAEVRTTPPWRRNRRQTGEGTTFAVARSDAVCSGQCVPRSAGPRESECSFVCGS